MVPITAAVASYLLAASALLGPTVWAVPAADRSHDDNVISNAARSLSELAHDAVSGRSAPATTDVLVNMARSLWQRSPAPEAVAAATSFFSRREAAPGRAIGDGVPLRIMPLGASITWGMQSETGNGYRGPLREAIVRDNGNLVNMVGSQRHGSMRDNQNEGYPGKKIAEVWERAAPVVRERMPNVVLINAGTNDCALDDATESAWERMQTMIEGIWAINPDATVLLSTLLPNKKESTDECVRRVNQDYIFKVFEPMFNAGKAIMIAHMYDALDIDTDFADSTHPTDAGYAKMAAVWHDYMLLADAMDRYGYFAPADRYYHAAPPVDGIPDDGNS